MGRTNSITSISSALDTAYYKYNCVIVAGSGNDSILFQPVKFPAKHPRVLGVSKSDLNDYTLQCYIGVDLDLSAPGHVVPVVISGYRPAVSYQYTNQTGTSLSSPLVAGIAGLMFSTNPCIDNKEVYDILRYRADLVHASTDPTSIYNYHYDPTKPWHSKATGYGRVNALKAVQTANSMKSTTIDLYIKDRFDDFGYANSYAANAIFDAGPDIWVRNQADGHFNQFSEAIEYSSTAPAYLYVRVHNKSCVSSFQNENVRLAWSKGASTFSYPQNWDGSNPAIGDLIGVQAIGLLLPGADTVLEFEWTIEPTVGTNQWSTCILAIIESPQETNPVMTDLGYALKTSNNITLKNLMIVDIFPGKQLLEKNGITFPHGGFMLIGNNDQNDQPVDIYFDVPAYTGQNIVEAAEVQIMLSEEMWQKYLALNPEDVYGLESFGPNTLLVTHTNAYLKNVPFENDIRDTMYVGFSFLVDQMEDDEKFYYTIRQHNFEDVLEGAMSFEINRSNRSRFDADGGPNQQIYLGQQALLSATDIGEDAFYNWYNNADSLVYEGKNLQLAPNTTQQYKLEVIAKADGFKDYDVVQVAVNPYSIQSLAPIPASQTTTLQYTAIGANTASLLIQPVAGNSNPISLPLNVQSQTATIDVSTLTTGWYVFVLICDNQIQQGIYFLKN